MQFLLGVIIGGILVAYWRDLKFRNYINSKLGRKPQPEKKTEEKKEITKDSDKPLI
jgi:hypothetical protein